MTHTNGKHVIIDFYSCYADSISTQSSLTEILKTTLDKINLADYKLAIHEFNQETTHSVIAQDCHITMHSYPELGYVALDYYVFKESVNFNELLKILKEAFGAEEVKMTSVNRADKGQLTDMKPRSKTTTTAKARVKKTGKKVKNAGSKVFKIIKRKKNK